MKSFVDLVHLKIRLQRVDEELCKIQKEMYQDRNENLCPYLSFQNTPEPSQMPILFPLYQTDNRTLFQQINMEQQKRYEVFDRIYTESMQEKKDERDRCRR